MSDFLAKLASLCEVQRSRWDRRCLSTRRTNRTKRRESTISAPPSSGSYGGARQRFTLALKRHAEQLEQAPSFLVCPGGADDRDFQTTRLVNLVVADLGEDQLLAQSQREVAA